MGVRTAMAVLLGVALSGLTVVSESAAAAAPAGALCANPAPGHAACFAIRGAGAGLSADDLAEAYQTPSNGGSGQTVAVIDAFDDPSAETDLATYRSRFGLDPCSSANGCFRKVDQRGGTAFPVADAGWAGQIAMDLDEVSATAPRAHLLLVEADDNGNEDLGAAVDEAVALGADVVSISYGTSYSAVPGIGEDPNEVTELDSYYNHPGVAVVTGSGSSGFGVTYPAASQYVTSVGGTSLSRDASSRGWTETAWAGSGGGCSLYEAKPSWQTDSGCGMRTVNDVSAVADPDTGVAVYDSYPSGGWSSFGGTAAPIIAGLDADGGPATPGTYPAAYPYLRPGALNDVTTGSDGNCFPNYLCTAGPGYDGPTGLGTPRGVTAFTANAMGEVSGTVVDAATNSPIAGATISVGPDTGTTHPDGSYALVLPVGAFSLTATAPGYLASSAVPITVAADATTNQNVALTSASPPPPVTVSGTITDASGHGWPLYATVSAGGVTAYTNPVTGKYSLTLPAGHSYLLRASAVYPGYPAISEDVLVGSTAQVDDVGLAVDAGRCSAPGYARSHGVCKPVAGGLVIGTVTDAGTHAPVNGVVVASIVRPLDLALTVATPADPNLGDGVYVLFSSLTGARYFAALKVHYRLATQLVDVHANQIVQQQFALRAG